MGLSNNVLDDLDLEIVAVEAYAPARVDVLSHLVNLIKLLFDVN